MRGTDKAAGRFSGRLLPSLPDEQGADAELATRARQRERLEIAGNGVVDKDKRDS